MTGGGGRGRVAAQHRRAALQARVPGDPLPHARGQSLRVRANVCACVRACLHMRVPTFARACVCMCLHKIATRGERARTIPGPTPVPPPSPLPPPLAPPSPAKDFWNVPISGMFQSWECSGFENVWDCSNFGNVPISGSLFFQGQTGTVVLRGPGTTPLHIKLRRGSPQVILFYFILF